MFPTVQTVEKCYTRVVHTHVTFSKHISQKVSVFVRSLRKPEGAGAGAGWGGSRSAAEAGRSAGFRFGRGGRLHGATRVALRGGRAGRSGAVLTLRAVGRGAWPRGHPLADSLPPDSQEKYCSP